eukprot:CAMPEP_0202903128 /NCGR_PEP_ID=MMETSP1392-20130828/21973_1 /ASSEMBLY_ACC=CAM_ASM_000868 /TAXON_ID=225041 /ORGANISM="Chlamydomonas chlamydogama, Strain SAG 11-48b" /LENGTH=40 /DNA_ID= /DNA_START= /DNA_END= /DNA_ORIENTATION=
MVQRVAQQYKQYHLTLDGPMALSDNQYCSGTSSTAAVQRV